LTELDLWKFAAGLGVFLFGLQLLEKAITKVIGGQLRDFLQHQTKNHLTSLVAGTGATALLQSSSVVSLMVLAFVGAGIIEMKNALGIIFGANLGTTFTGWIVTTLGFKLHIESLALPLIAIGSMGRLFFTKKKLFSSFTFSLGLGFLLLGLDYMKTSIEALTTLFNIDLLRGYNAFVFLFIGIVFTAIIQSSSATMMITLSALNSGIIDLHSAAALIVGADLGTTSTVLLGAIKASAAKKQVAMAHLLFNLVTTTIAFLSIPLLLALISNYTNIESPLYTLVAFHSSFNLIGIFIFIPLIKPLASFLEKRFIKESQQYSSYLYQVPTTVTDAALTALDKETKNLLRHVTQLNIKALKINVHQDKRPTLPGNQTALSFSKYYELVKEIEGETLDYGLRLQKNPLNTSTTIRINNIISATRDAVMAAKSLKDIRHNLSVLRHSNDPNLQKFHQLIYEFETHFYQQLIALWEVEHHSLLADNLANLYSENSSFYNQCLKTIYKGSLDSTVAEDEMQISSLLNVSREAFTSNLNLLNGFKSYRLPKQALGELQDIPSTISEADQGLGD
jgi:phosphate:Na+ symporter